MGLNVELSIVDLNKKIYIYIFNYFGAGWVDANICHELEHRLDPLFSEKKPKSTQIFL